MSNIIIDQTLYKTRPNKANRSQIEMDTYDVLERLGIPYFRLDHDETPSIEVSYEVEKLLEIEIYKNLFLCNYQKTNFYLLMMPGRKKFRTKDLSKQINSSRLSFAEAEEMEKYLKIKPGSVSVLGLIDNSGGGMNELTAQAQNSL